MEFFELSIKIFKKAQKINYSLNDIDFHPRPTQ